MTLSQNLNVSPFEIFDREIDEVIMLINFYIELGNAEKPTQSNANGKEQRIRVNDETATGGWF